MIAVLAAALALAATDAPDAVAAPLPVGTARYRMELAGVPVGVTELSVRCRDVAGTARCDVEWLTRVRLPEAAGGATRERRVTAPVDGEGRLAGPVRVAQDGRTRTRAAPPGQPVPASLAEVVLAASGGAERRCIRVLEEETGRVGEACAQPAGYALEVELLGTRERVGRAPDGFPASVELPSQRTRFLRDPAAELPARAPPLEVRVPGPAGPPRRFCGLAPDPAPPALELARLPAAAPDGRPCQLQAADYARQAAGAGFPARVALGVAHDGEGFVWHAWAEVRVGRAWIAVDPAFGQRPARGPRFTVAREQPDDASSRQAAGARILACWGDAAVE